MSQDSVKSIETRAADVYAKLTKEQRDELRQIALEMLLIYGGGGKSRDLSDITSGGYFEYNSRVDAIIPNQRTDLFYFWRTRDVLYLPLFYLVIGDYDGKETNE